MCCLMISNVNCHLKKLVYYNCFLLRDNKYLIETYYHSCHYHCIEVYKYLVLVKRNLNIHPTYLLGICNFKRAWGPSLRKVVLILYFYFFPELWRWDSQLSSWNSDNNTCHFLWSMSLVNCPFLSIIDWRICMENDHINAQIIEFSQPGYIPM